MKALRHHIICIGNGYRGIICVMRRDMQVDIQTPTEVGKYNCSEVIKRSV